MNKRPILMMALEATQPVLRWRMSHESISTQEAPAHHDGVLGLGLRDGLEQKFLVDVKTIDRFNTLRGLREQAISASALPRLLVAPYISPAAASMCQKTGLNFIDTAGNAFIDVPGCYVFITGRPRPKYQRSNTGHEALGSASTLRVIFSLLGKPDVARQSVRDIAVSAGVSLGSAVKALESLRRLGHLSPGDKGDRRLLATHELKMEWARLYPIVLRKKLNPQRYSAYTEGWWKTARLQAEQAVWGGEVGAAFLTSYLQPEQVTIYCWTGRDKLMMQHRLRPDPQGAIEILDAFWTAPPQSTQPIAPRLLIYADLLASLDDRNREVAHMLQEKLDDAESAV